MSINNLSINKDKVPLVILLWESFPEEALKNILSIAPYHGLNLLYDKLLYDIVTELNNRNREDMTFTVGESKSFSAVEIEEDGRRVELQKLVDDGFLKPEGKGNIRFRVIKHKWLYDPIVHDSTIPQMLK